MQTNRSTGIILSVLLALLCQGHLGVAQQAGAQQTQPSHTPKLQPLSVPHLYWHFLIYLNVLDRKADEFTAHGKDHGWLRNDLQTRLQFSDTEFAPIRASSQRLASELVPINQQIQSLQSIQPSASNTAQVKSLINQRELAINNEIANLTQSLSPQKRAKLEAFMAQFFAPKIFTTQPTMAPANQ
jgi:hypothetical protein